MLRLFIGLLFAAGIYAQAPVPRPFKVVRLDPALDAIISTGAKIEILGEHFGLTEGPVWIQVPRAAANSNRATAAADCSTPYSAHACAS